MTRHSKKPPNSLSIGQTVDTLAEAVAGFDFGVDADDFILYELNRMIEEDRASFEDEEFRILIDEGIREHVEENLEVRARLAGKLRRAAQALEPSSRTVAERVIRALENTGYDLRNAAVVVRTYTAYLFQRLQSLDNVAEGEAEAQDWIQSWKTAALPLNGEAVTASDARLVSDLRKLGRAALGPAGDLLTGELENRRHAEAALAVLSHIRSSVSARVLAYAVSEPMLDEDLEARAYSALLAFWPLARPYILHSLHSHAHEDLPFRWFQLLIAVDEPTASELVFEEMRMHGSQENFHEDLWALASLLNQSRDPELEEKVLEWINSPQLPPPVVPMLHEFLKEYQPPVAGPAPNDAWTGRKRLLDLNAQYAAASQLFDNGHREEAGLALEKILAETPDYPFAVMLQNLLKGGHQ